jgi:predicted DNA-binding WGR domain protein
MRRFEFIDDSSSKFWEMDYTEGESSFTVTFGKIGTAGQTQTKSFDTSEKAAAESEKLVKEKTRKGYLEAGALRAVGRSTDAPLAGRPVGDFPAATPAPGVAIRLHLDWDSEETFESLIDSLAAHPDAAQLEALVIGNFAPGDSMSDPAAVFDGLVKHAATFPNLVALFYGDVEQEVSEISWIAGDDFARVANAFPNLEVLHIRGDGAGSIKGLSLPKLQSLTFETGGLRPAIVKDVLTLDLPSLRHLELWLGTPSYEGDTSVADLEPLLAGRVHTKLQYLGLRNSEIADAVAFAVSQSPLLAWIEELDFSLGTIGDEGMLALSQMGPTPKLRSLNVSHHYGGPGAVKALKAAMKDRNVILDVSDHQDDDEPWVSISE